MVKIIGAGLAGCEAAWYLANKGVKVKLYEQKPIQKSPAHESNLFAELVCSNSLRSNDMCVAPGLLKSEMKKLSFQNNLSTFMKYRWVESIPLLLIIKTSKKNVKSMS